jgi:hypothetical protein
VASKSSDRAVTKELSLQVITKQQKLSGLPAGQFGEVRPGGQDLGVAGSQDMSLVGE